MCGLGISCGSQVTVVVMISRLVEKAKLKAHQYWPEGEAGLAGQERELGDGYKVKLQATHFTGTFFMRYSIGPVSLARQFSVWSALYLPA